MTQEQLALMLGVSRQSVTKWEAEKSYPEMDKLLKLCQIFDVTLDDLVQGDLTTSVPTAAVQARAAVLREAAGGPPQDVCGYDEHMRAFAWKIAQSKRLARLFIAPGNAGTALCGTNVDINPTNFGSVKQFVLSNNINMVVVGPEEPLVRGLSLIHI